MNSLVRIFRKIGRKLRKMRKRTPVRVFLFHQVSEQFDEATMIDGDWTQINQFKHNISCLRKEYTFIPLDKAYRKMRRDIFRFRNYAVLTADDGWASLNNILPWLAEQRIPVTLFLNPGYFDGQHFRDKVSERYLLWDDVDRIPLLYPKVTIASHGWNHLRATEQSEEEFRMSVESSVELLKRYPNYIPFFAYTYGSFSAATDSILKELDLVPVLIDKETNMDDLTCIHRELIDGIVL